MAPGPVHEVRRQGAPDGPVGGRAFPAVPRRPRGTCGTPWGRGGVVPGAVCAAVGPGERGRRFPCRRRWCPRDHRSAGTVGGAAGSPPAVDRLPVAAHVRDPALTGLRGAGIVVSCAQGALGLLPFAVRLGDLRVAGVHLLAIARHGGPEGGGAESRGATEFGPTSGRSREGRHARPRGPDGTSRPGREGPPAGLAPRYHQQSTTFESTTQRR
jgi:hypothetical protein